MGPSRVPLCNTDIHSTVRDHSFERDFERDHSFHHSFLTPLGLLARVGESHTAQSLIGCRWRCLYFVRDSTRAVGPGIAGQYLVLLDDTVLPRIGSNCYCGGEGLLLPLLWIMLQLQAFMDSSMASPGRNQRVLKLLWCPGLAFVLHAAGWAASVSVK